MALLPFDLLEYEVPERLDRVLGIEPKWNAWVEIHNLINSVESTHDCGPEDVVRICRKYGVKISNEFRKERITLYAAYLDYCLDGGDLEERSRELLAHLARMLFLPIAALAPIHERAFGRTVSKVLSDDCVTLEERLLLYKLQHTLGIRAGDAEAEYESKAREKLLTMVALALRDGILSPEERRAIEALEREFGVSVPSHVSRLLDQAASTWAIERGLLPKTNVGITLDSGEVGHCRIPGAWHRLNYARLRVLLSAHRAWLHRGETERLRVPAKSLYGRRNEGWIVLTNRRLILVNETRKVESYRIGSLGAAEQYINGVRIGLPGGRSLFVNAGHANRAMFSVLSRLRDSKNSTSG